VTLALARLTALAALPRLLLTALSGLLTLLAWLLLSAAALLATLTALLTTLVLLAGLLFIRIHNCSLVCPPTDNKRVDTTFLGRQPYTPRNRRTCRRARNLSLETTLGRETGTRRKSWVEVFCSG
jgi:hypothetical protein